MLGTAKHEILSITNCLGRIKQTYMHIIDDKENIVKEGTIVCLKAQPDEKMLITKYQQRVYFCARMSAPSGKILPYFERELLKPLND